MTPLKQERSGEGVARGVHLRKLSGCVVEN